MTRNEECNGEDEYEEEEEADWRRRETEIEDRFLSLCLHLYARKSLEIRHLLRWHQGGLEEAVYEIVLGDVLASYKQGLLH